MERFPMPNDEASAKKLLGSFMANATNLNLKGRVAKAVELVYGTSFTIRVDSSRRMCFFCLVCTKEMNNVKSLQEHRASGSHIKNEDSKYQEAGSSFKSEPKSFRKYPLNSLQGKIENSREDIIGVHFIEEYENGRKSYFKCTLCGAHGNADAIYNHVVGNNHTDRYIKLRIVLKKPVLDSDMRQRLRKVINEKERYTADHINIIEGSGYYPTKWEQAHRSQSKSKRNTEYKFDLEENELKIKKEITMKEMKDQNLQCLSLDCFNQILLKCNIIVEAYLNGADIQSSDDLKMTLNLLFYLLHLLRYAVKGSKQDAEGERLKDLNNQAKVIKTCLHHLYDRIIPRYVGKNGSISY